MNLFQCFDPVTRTWVQQQYPQTIEEAISLGLKKYWPGDQCPEHYLMQPVVFVKSGIRQCCAHDNALKAYNTAVLLNGEPSNPSEARIRGIDYYWRETPFPNCGHVGLSTLTGYCYECANEKRETPRQVAVRNGDIWYTPEPGDKCPHGHTSRRRVNNGSCEQCEQLRAKGRVPFYRQHPDMVIGYEAAVVMGLNVYRTGEPCRAGHTGWRYVSNRGCLTCMGKE